MIIGGVDFPKALLAAQRAGELAIFAGAGVSMPAPSNYPNFKDLANRVAAGKLTADPEEPLDHFLGRLADTGVQVHQQVSRTLNDPASQPNSLHFDLLRLFRSPNFIRVVTTNFDSHFTNAERFVFANELPCELHSAPALPLGHSFSGIVALHGSVGRPPERLVLTDSDFGRAYLTEGWARIFLQRLFETYTVVFVGYSHNDPVMNYIARGFTPEMGKSKRFALVAKGDESLWTYRGIIPVTYRLSEQDNSHSMLASALASWAQMARLGVLEREERIKAIVANPPSLVDSEDTDFIEDALSDVSTTRFFVWHARKVAWLKWVEAKNLLKPLFSSRSTISEVDAELAKWMVEEFQCKYPGETLSVVMRQGQTLSPFLWVMLVHKLSRGWADSSDRAVLRRWLAVLLTLYSENTRCDVLCHLAASFVFPEDSDVALLTFEFLVHPIVRLEHDLWSELRDEDKTENVNFELGTRGNGFWLNHFWTRFFEPHLDTLAERIEPVLRSELTFAAVLYQADKGTLVAWDALSLSRNTLDDMDHGQRRGGLGVLIDAALVVARWYVSSRPEQIGTLVEQWYVSSSFILKRIAVLMISESAERTADDKLTWLLTHNLLYAYGFKHEVFSVLKDAYPRASPCVRQEIVTAIETDRPSVPINRQDVGEYEKYNLLVWLTECAPNEEIATAALGKMQKLHEQFHPREHPDLDVSWGPLQVGLVSPLGLDELVLKEPSEVIEYLISYRETSPMGPSRDGLLQSVTAAASKSYDWGRKLSDQLLLRADSPIDLWSALVRAWTGIELTNSQWTDLLTLLDSQPKLHGSISSEIATLLESGIKKPASFIPADCYELISNLSNHVWEEVCSTSHPPKREEKAIDWVFRAINHPAGTLTLFWLSWLVKEKKDAGSDWRGIPETLRRPLDRVVGDDSYAGVLGRVLLASQLNLLFTADESWTSHEVLPLFDWDVSPEQTLQSFNGFMVWGQQSELLIPKLIPMYEKVFPYTRELGEVRTRFTEYLAALAVISSVNPVRHGWLNHFISLTQDSDRKAWASYVRQYLRGLNEVSRATVWRDWIKEYWTARITGLSVLPQPEELGEMVEWALYLGSAFPEVAEIISSGPSFELRNSFLFRELAETTLPEVYPNPVAILLLSVLKNTEVAEYDLDQVERVVKRISPLGASIETLNGVCDQLAKLGYSVAGNLKQWLRDQNRPA